MFTWGHVLETLSRIGTVVVQSACAPLVCLCAVAFEERRGARDPYPLPTASSTDRLQAVDKVTARFAKEGMPEPSSPQAEALWKGALTRITAAQAFAKPALERNIRMVRRGPSVTL